MSYDPFPGGPDGPPDPSVSQDPTELGPDALTDRRKLAEAVLQAGTDAVSYLHALVRDTGEETKERRMAAQSLLSLTGLQALTGRAGSGATAGSDPLNGLLGMLDGQPRSKWASAAVGRQKCPEPTCDWPEHRGGVTAHGHTVEAGYQDGCGYRHSMMATHCGPVQDNESTRSDFWEART